MAQASTHARPHATSSLHKLRGRLSHEILLGSIIHNSSIFVPRGRFFSSLALTHSSPACPALQFYDAVNECQTCNEFYCSSCWDTIHYGGKRKRHKFRALFDFYDKRIDYGDDEFPSKWPTEIEQDDMIGWQLRVGEDHRDPDAEQVGNQ